MIFDLHSHILPCIDDGSRDMEESLEMARIAADSGVRVMVATPHANQRGLYENYATGRMGEIFHILKNKIEDNRIPLTLLPGMEIFASADIMELIRRGRLCPMAGTSLFLIEFPFDCPQRRMEYLLEEMLEEGCVPLIAHPERYYCVQDEPMLLKDFREMGCLIQLNKGSVFGRFGPLSRETGKRILDRKLADVIGSDAHRADRRTPDMEPFRQYLIKEYGGEEAARLLEENPKRLLAGAIGIL